MHIYLRTYVYTEHNANKNALIVLYADDVIHSRSETVVLQVHFYKTIHYDPLSGNRATNGRRIDHCHIQVFGIFNPIRIIVIARSSSRLIGKCQTRL